MNKKTVITIFITAVLFFVLGALSNIVKEVGVGACPKQDENDTFKAGWNAARERLVETGVVSRPEGEETYTELSGTIEEVSGNKLVVNILTLDVLADPELKQRVVEITNNTEVYKFIKKDSGVYEQEVAQYNEAIKEIIDPSSDNYPSRPYPLQKVSGSVSDFSKGQKLQINTETDLKELKEFEAKTVIILK